MGTWDGRGEVDSIYTVKKGGKKPSARNEATAEEGKGLVGDRYHRDINDGYYSGDSNWDAEVTLITIEAIQDVKDEYGLEFDIGEVRRNIITRNVPLNQLKDERIQVGETVLYCWKHWPPCSHLAELIGSREIVVGLSNTGGMGAHIEDGGTIRPGDEIKLLPDD